jgi:hypothetical protein
VTAKEMKMGNVCCVKSMNDIMLILIAPVRITLSQQGPKLGHQVSAKGMEMENGCWIKNK